MPATYAASAGLATPQSAIARGLDREHGSLPAAESDAINSRSGPANLALQLCAEVQNPADSGARWCAAWLLAQESSAAARQALARALRAEPVTENVRTIGLLLTGENPSSRGVAGCGLGLWQPRPNRNTLDADRSTNRSTGSNVSVRFTLSCLGAAYRNRTDDLRITSASLWPTELRRRAVLADRVASLQVRGCALARARRTAGRIGRVRLSEAEARARLAAARVARLATAGADGQPHLVPVTFAVDGDLIYTAVDHKPKTTVNLRRLRNIRENPRVALLADHYAEDWDALWWVRVDGSASIVEHDDTAARHPVDVLARRYEQYGHSRPAGPVIIIRAGRWTGWAADERDAG
jgi:PPOX class probable F420-dependent enzyme